MLNIRDVRDAWLQANSDSQIMFADVLLEFVKPDLLMQIGMSVGTMRPRELDMLDEQTAEKVMEVLNA